MEERIIELHNFLYAQKLLKNSPAFWWPNAFTFEVVLGAVLTQNTKWENVQKSLANLEGYLELESFLELDIEAIKQKIRPSGFYNQKSQRLYDLARAIKREFGSFEVFQKEASRAWLLVQKGIGKESADAILCYGCRRDVMVIDAYTKRVCKSFGIELGEYDAYRELFESAVKNYWERLKSLYHDKQHAFCLFHGMIVEYCKK